MWLYTLHALLLSSPARSRTCRFLEMPAEDFTDRFRVSGILAEGKEGKVYNTSDKLCPANSVVVKVTQTANKRHPKNKNEIASLLKMLPYDGVPKIVAYRIEYSAHRCASWIAMTKEDGPTLHEVMEADKSLRVFLPEKDVWKIFAQLLRIVSRLLRLGIHHRDIKEKNVIVNLATLKPSLIDFGLSTTIRKNGFSDSDGVSKQVVRDSFPPEFYSPKLFDAERAEVWALGVLLYKMLYLRSPFKTQEDKLSGTVDADVDNPHALPLIRKMLQPDWEKRPSILTVIDSSRHAL
ncbi:MAG: CAMK protein kinase [Amphiamblys sp. WSBS2006]|nr:MAG: CAMK protein kinase [Amphiamblys sp. WSBS2006]